ncbi:MAG: hypothetical protein WCQ53_06990 [bacterium]
MKKCFLLAALFALANPIFAQSIKTVQDLFLNGDLAVSEQVNYDKMDGAADSFLDSKTIHYYIKGTKKLAYRVYWPQKESPTTMTVDQFWANGEIKEEMVFQKTDDVTWVKNKELGHYEGLKNTYIPKESKEYREDGTLKSKRTFDYTLVGKYTNDQFQPKEKYYFYEKHPYTNKMITFDENAQETGSKDFVSITNDVRTMKEGTQDFLEYSNEFLNYHENMLILYSVNGVKVDIKEFDKWAGQGGAIENLIIKAVNSDKEIRAKILQRAEYIVGELLKQSPSAKQEDVLIKLGTTINNATPGPSDIDAKNRILRYVEISPSISLVTNLADYNSLTTLAVNKMMDELKNIGGFSTETLSMLMQDGSIDFLSKHCSQEDSGFLEILKGVMQIGFYQPGKYNLDYDKDLRFKEVVKSIQDVKTVVKK